MVKLIKLIVSIIITLVAGAIGSIFTASAIPTWYLTLKKPFFNPPNYLFAPVWTILYILMGIAFFLIWTSKDQKKKSFKRKCFIYFFAQLVFNVLWSIGFFGLHSPLLGFIIILILWYLIFKTIVYFAKVEKTAAYLLYPYIAWVSFAAILNFAVLILNF